MTTRIIVWGTGNVGRLGLHTVIARPDFELVGVVVSSPAKIGVDAGDLLGLEPVGVTCTDDVGPLLDCAPEDRADACAYFASADIRPGEAAADMARCLEAGLDEVSTSIVPLIYLPAADQGMVEMLDRACKAGNASMFTNGVDPGWANDLLPLMLAGTCERIDTIRMMEVVNYATYDAASVLFDTMGFGKPMDETPLLLLPGILTHAWGPVVSVVAEGLGVELDEIEEWYERVPADRDIEGNPSMTVDGAAHGEDGDHNTGNLVSTVGRVLNAIPAVQAAEPGMLSVLDLPLQTGTGTMFR